mmetsp:Transcript_126498/g.282801  ORF Transcript_126498/g.282801 Transcript_126498/m.282801 type:complete len:884 (+) Transcript_126498:101-2752(+)
MTESTMPEPAAPPAAAEPVAPGAADGGYPPQAGAAGTTEAKAPPAQPASKAGFGKAPSKPAYRTGQRVILHSLNKEELNGHRGVVVKWKEDVGRYAVRVAGKEMAIKADNIKPEGGIEEAMKWNKKYGKTSGVMYNPVVYSRVPGAGPAVKQWIGQVKAGRRCVVRAEKSSEFDDEPVPLWFGDAGFVRSSPVDVALLINDIGGNPEDWPKALSRVLDRFPAAAGRLRPGRPGTHPAWKIVLNNAGVPFTTASVPPCGLPSAEDLQMVCCDEQCGFFDLGLEGGGEENPLLRIKLVYEEGTERGVLGVSFDHALCDISGLAQILHWLHKELTDDLTVQAPIEPCHARAIAQETIDAVPSATPEEEASFAPHWPLWSPAMEKWCFLARRLRSGLRGRPDGAATVLFSIPKETLDELKVEAEAGGAAGVTAFEVLVCFIGMKLLRMGRMGHATLITKDYRASLEEANPGKGLDHLFANAVTHGLCFQLPAVGGAEVLEMPLAEGCKAMKACVDAVSLKFVDWQRKTNHYCGLPNLFGGLCVNSWGRALSDVKFVETYAMGLRSVDERAANMSFPLDTAYLQVLPLPSGNHNVLLTAPVTDITGLLKELPGSHFNLPHVSQVRPHSFKVPLPGKVMEKLNPSVETHHMFLRIACLGDSMTACGYPKQLQALFDRHEIQAQVRNFGVAGATAQRFADKPYWDERKLEDARLWRPHFVIATFGSNDAKSSNWDVESFEKDYKEMLDMFLERTQPRPEVYLVTPPPLYEADQYEMEQDVVNNELPLVIPRVAAAAAAVVNDPIIEMCKKMRQEAPPEVLAKVRVIDAFSSFGGADLRRRGYIAEDGVHPNERGTRLLTTLIFSEIRHQGIVCLKNWESAPKAVPENDMF